MTVQPGWYADPAEPTTQRYWDGEGWVGAPLPIDATPPPGPPAETEPLPPTGTPTAPDTGTGTGTGHDTAARPDQTAAPTGAPGPGGAWPGSPAGPPGHSGQPAPPGYPAHAGQPVPPGYPVHPGQTVPAGPPGHPSWGWAAPGHPYGYPPPQPRPHGLPLAPLGRRLAARLIDIGLLLPLVGLANSFLIWRYIQEIAPLYREILRRSMAGDSSTQGLPQPGDQADMMLVSIILITAGLWFAYEVPATANSGQTIGKRLMGLRVVTLPPQLPGVTPAGSAPGGPPTGPAVSGSPGGPDPGGSATGTGGAGSPGEPAQPPGTQPGGQLGFRRSLRRWHLMGFGTMLWLCCFGFLIQLIDAVFPLFDRPLRQALHDKAAQTVVVAVPAGTRRPKQPHPPGTPSGRDRPDNPGDPA